jgi:hypothetical protein
MKKQHPGACDQQAGNKGRKHGRTRPPFFTAMSFAAFFGGRQKHILTGAA